MQTHDKEGAISTLALCQKLAKTAVARTRPSPQSIAKMRKLRDEGLKWSDIGRRFKLTVGQVRHYLGLCQRNPETPFRTNPDSAKRARARRHAMFKALGVSQDVYGELLALARAEAKRTGRPLAEVRMEYGAPTVRQWDKVQKHLTKEENRHAKSRASDRSPASVPDSPTPDPARCA